MYNSLISLLPAQKEDLNCVHPHRTDRSWFQLLAAITNLVFFQLLHSVHLIYCSTSGNRGLVFSLRLHNDKLQSKEPVVLQVHNVQIGQLFCSL